MSIISDNTIIRIFVCVNQKAKGKCCAMFNSNTVYEYLKQEINKKHHLFVCGNIKVVKTSCLGFCTKGPNIFISPDNSWYTFSSIEDINEMINLRLIQGHRVEQLINKGIYDKIT